MFNSQVYAERRARLRQKIGTGFILLPGNEESSMNYAANVYPFRQDGNFRYFFGLERPGLIGCLDADSGQDFLFGSDFDLEDTVWMGPQPTLSELAEKTGLAQTGTRAQCGQRVKTALAQDRKVHYAPPYRGDHFLRLEDLHGTPLGETRGASAALIRSIVELRSVKSEAEIAEIEKALDVTHEAFAAVAMAAKPGAFEYELVGKIEGLFSTRNRSVSYPIILTVRGETLHNTERGNRLRAGDLLLVDAGATSPRHYASDITRTFPVGGKFSPEQRDVYTCVLRAQTQAIADVKPGRPYREIHLRAAAVLVSGLKDMGLMKGNVESAVEAGAHALFFPHGLGHMLGLDVHDMEGLGEDFVGYDATVSRSVQFGLKHLRLAKALQAGNVLTVEPGLYFIPPLIDAWKAEGKFAEFVEYARLESFKNFGGIRIEDDVLVTETGSRALGKPIPKTMAEIEAAMG